MLKVSIISTCSVKEEISCVDRKFDGYKHNTFSKEVGQWVACSFK